VTVTPRSDDGRRRGTTDAGTPRAEGHPAPERERVPLAALWFGLAGGPVAWSIQTLVSLPVAAHACFPRLTPLSSPAFGGVRGVVFLLGVMAFGVSALATWVAWRTWSHTRQEQQGASGEGARHRESVAALETGEGRTRFMALAGLMTSIVFLLVTASHAAMLFLVAPCAA
jgi:hypothetical protein